MLININVPIPVQSVLSENKTSMYSIVMESLVESSVHIKLAAHQSVDSLLQLPDLLNEQERQNIAVTLVNALFNEADEAIRYIYSSQKIFI